MLELRIDGIKKSIEKLNRDGENGYKISGRVEVKEGAKHRIYVSS